MSTIKKKLLPGAVALGVGLFLLGAIPKAEAISGTVIGWGYNCCGQLNMPTGLTNVVSVDAAAGNFSLALKEDGKVVAWGQNAHGQCTVPGGLSNVVAIAGGNDFSMALRADGTVAAWGEYYPQDGVHFLPAFVPTNLNNVVAIAAGFAHSMALKSDGTVVVWGSPNAASPPPAGLSNVVAIAASAAQCLALKSDGTVVAWANTVGPAYNPPANLTNVIAISAKYYNFAALKRDGTFEIWGKNDYGQLTVPPGVNRVSKISCGTQLSLVVKDDGALKAWGWNSYGQTNVPATQQAILGISAGGGHCLAIVQDLPPQIVAQPAGITTFSGNNVTFQAGVLGSRPISYQWRFNGNEIPGATNYVLNLTNVTSANAGIYTLVASNSLGTVTSEGAELVTVGNAPIILSQPVDQVGRLGESVSFSVVADGSKPLRYQWQQNGTNIPGGTNSVLSLSMLALKDAGNYSVVVSNDFGTQTSSNAVLTIVPVMAWGFNTHGQTIVPLSATNAVAVAAGSYHNLALRADGTVVGWGDNSSGQITIPPDATNLTAISAGARHSVGLRADGTVIAWGTNDLGQTSVPASATNVVAISAGQEHTLALRGDGTVVAWGYNSAGQTNVPLDLTNVVAIAAGSTHSLALKGDGTVAGWGDNSYFFNYTGQATPPAGLNGVKAISAGWGYSLAVKTDGSIVPWGRQSIPPAVITDIAEISAGVDFVVGLRGDGTITTFGSNNNGEGDIPLVATNLVAADAGSRVVLALSGAGVPRIMQPFLSHTLKGGMKIALTGQAVGEFPLSYQWQHDGTNIGGATDACLTFNNPQARDAGIYSLIVSNSQGTTQKQVASLTVEPSIPVFDLQPVSQTNLAGTSVILTTEVRGTEPLTFQWQHNGTNIVGATNRTLSLPNEQGADAGTYVLVATNPMGSTASTTALLAVFPYAQVLSGLPDTYHGDVVCGDYDNDGFLDVLLPGPGFARIYHNNGNGTFTDINAGLPINNAGAWGDYDNDGNLDFAVAGVDGAAIYHNNGNGTFTNINVTLPAASTPYVAWGDYNNDGRLDLLVSGSVYRNDGNGNFSLRTAGLPALAGGVGEWGDYDNDGRLDLLMTGSLAGVPTVGVYHNNGDDTFTNINAGLPGMTYGKAKWIDLDGDGRLDIFLAGATDQGYATYFYHNNGDGTFSNLNLNLPNVLGDAAAVGDYDNDGRQDLFLSGRMNDGSYFLQLYHNDLNGGLEPTMMSTNNLMIATGAAFGDVDNDGRLDLFLSGFGPFQSTTRLYKNYSSAPNIVPTVPTLLAVTVNGSSLGFRWSAAQDGQTPQAALTYNLRVGSAPGAIDMVAPMAGTNGQRRLPQAGNAGHVTGWFLTNLNFGTYYWSVQAVDGAFAGSAFSPEQKFVFAAKTLPASGVTSSQATLGGRLAANGLPTTAWFEWGTGTNFENRTSPQSIAATTNEVTINANLAGLTPGSGYQYRIVVTNSSGLYLGGDQTFITLNIPQIVALNPTNVSAANATLRALLNPNGSGTTAYFEYGLTRSYGSISALISAGNGTTFAEFSRNLTGLIGGQVYHYRVVATNGEGAAYTADLTFTTPPGPVVTTLAANNVAAASAMLNGTVRPNTLSTMAFFQYGLTTNYDGVTPPVDVGSGTNLISFGAPIIDLVRTSNYHFRAVASNAYAVSYGADQTFKTTNDVIVLAASNIGMTNATLNGLVNPLGVSNSVFFEYGLTTNLGNVTASMVFVGATNLVPVSLAQSGLLSGSNYFYRVVAVNSSGVRYSSLASFQTLPLFNVVNPGLAGSINGSMSWGDYDKDGRLDMLVTDAGSTRIYRNLGGGAFTNVSTTIPGVTFGTVSWGDYNNDGWLDILISGTSSSGPMTRIYRNNKNGTFTDINAGLPNLGVRSARWGDFDNDGKSDVLLVGETNSVAVTMLYRNNGDGTFSDMHANLPAFLDAAVACADYDNDGRPDVLLLGRVGEMYANVFAKLYHNDGNWTFHDTGVPLEGARLGHADWGDYDGDGLLDLVLGGLGQNYLHIVRIYHNNGDGTFSNQTGGLEQYSADAVIWGDYDSDGRLDLLVRGQGFYSNIIPPNSYSAVLRNNGDGTFTPSEFPLPETWSTCGGWIDYDNDGRLDAVIAGNSRTGAILRFYHNNLSISNTAPTAPTNLAANVSSNAVVFSWNRAMDAQSGANGLSYGLRIGLTPGGGEVLSPLADGNGVRRVVGLGNAGENTQLAMHLPGGTYYWSVQAIDGSFVGSPFGIENSFVILGPLFVETVPATNLTTTRATIRGKVYASGVQTTAALEWGNSTNLENVVTLPMIPLNAGTNQFSLVLTNLLPGKTYYYRMVATNFLGLVRGEILEFQTAQVPGFLQAGSFSSNSNSFGLTFNGSSGFKYRVYASTNLVNWTSVGFATEVGTNQFMFNDIVGTNYPRRFYRVLAP